MDTMPHPNSVPLREVVAEIQRLYGEAVDPVASRFAFERRPGAGEIKGGLEELILTTNKGAFVGGGWAGIQPKPAKTVNDDTYGPNADLKAILNSPGGKYAPAKPVRAKLTEMVVQAWDVSGKGTQARP